MNPFDLVIIIVLIIFFFRGISRGFVHEVFGLVGLVIALVIAITWMSDGALVLRKVLELPAPLASLISFVTLFLLILLVFRLIIHLIQRILRISALGWLDRLGGALVGLAKGAILVSIIAIAISLLPLSETISNKQKQSLLFTPARRFVPALFNFVVDFSPKTKSFYNELKESLSDPSRFLSKEASEFMDSLGKDTKTNQDHVGKKQQR